MTTQRLLRLKHDRHVLGFLSARVVRDGERETAWSLRLESPAELDIFRGHLADGSSMALSMITGDGDHLRGEACVANVSDAVEATVVTLSGLGPLHRG